MSMLITAPSGIHGLDANTTISAEAAAKIREAGYRFVVRYIRRGPSHSFDLTAAELATLHAAGLAVMPVQHVESAESWVPDESKGMLNGKTAALEVASIGFPSGVSVWCDLEGVAPDTSEAAVMYYCNEWYSAVSSAGFLPGLYVGWHCGLPPDALYENLRFQAYWSAYNLNADQYPATRGVQMQQQIRRPNYSGDFGFDYDVDTIREDALGGLPMLFAPDGWSSV